MSTFLQFLLLGLGAGAVYALLAQGVVVIYRSSNVLNFAQGAQAMIAGFTYADLTMVNGWSPAAACIVVTIGSALVGVVIYWLVMRPLRRSSMLSRAIATLGLLIIIQAIGVLIWADETQLVASFLPSDPVQIGSEIQFSQNRLWLVGIAAAITLVLWAGFRYTTAGLATGAVAENPRAAGALGWSADRVATVNWALGSGLAGLAGVLIAPLTGLNVGTVTMLVIPALAAALIGRFASLPITFAGAVLIGMAQSVTGNYVSQQGVAESLPFIIIILYLVVAGRGLPSRDTIAARLPALGTGQVRPLVVVPLTLVVAVLLLVVMGGNLVAAVTASLALGIVMLSVVVLTGYAGQLSLAQLTLGGVGALVAARIMRDGGWGFGPAALVGAAAAVPVGLLFAIPALRTRGVTLAIVTLGLAGAADAIVFNNATITGGPDGTPIPPTRLFGLDVTATVHGERYAVLVLVLFVVCAAVIGNVRRGRAGRRLIAVRTNERAAAALGINVQGAKLYAFGLSACIAAVGGILSVFTFRTVLYTPFDPFQSIVIVAYAVIGGLGFLIGPIWGSLLVAGGIGTWLSHEIIPGLEQYFVLLGGIFVVLFLARDPDGIAAADSRFAALLARRVARRRRRRAPGVAEPDADARAETLISATPVAPEPVQPTTLEVTGLHVRFGGVHAVQGASLTVAPGEILGLIGPNGAGKTTAIDAITGFVRPSEGAVLLNGVSIGEWSAHRRARAGISRSFQHLELFDDVTVFENLLAASDSRDVAGYFTNLVTPQRRELSPTAIAAAREFQLEDDLGKRPMDMPYGRRRLVAIARAVALAPSVLLLDEPAAGLDEQESDELAALVRRLADTWKFSILLVEHDMSFVMRVCDRLAVLDFGIQIASGPTETVRNDPRVIAAYLGEADTEAGVAESPSARPVGQQ